ncbi:RteC domain-containing protein [Flavobacterium sp. I3-2]|uniref:RteC domain-containing protein n=1 Tax=Flavobacterium sp. I3-2 TaxID=2748319 RepID=UPI0015AE4697|nr:RteC domain-containing protein [Flavobacterium sp. I3-2]
MLQSKIQEVIKDCSCDVALFETCDIAQESKLKKQITLIKTGITKLNQLVRDNEFESVDFEIEFFKKHKPELISDYLYLNLLLRLYQEVPQIAFNDISVFKKYSKEAYTFFKTEPFFYNYLKQNDCSKDDLFFKRLETTLNYYSPNHLFSDIRSTCSHGLLTAKMKAYEKWLAFCNKKIKAIKNQNTSKTSTVEVSPLVWQAHKVDAIELVYALYYSGAVNVEQCTLQELALQFEKIFNIEICSQLYRDFLDIKRRKIDSTRFLNKLADKLKFKIEQGYF